MRIALLSDIHGNAYALRKVLDDCTQMGVEQYIFCGDYISGGFDVKEVFERIQKLPTLAVVLGNREEYMLDAKKTNKAVWTKGSQYEHLAWVYDQLRAEDFAYMARMPMTAQIEIEGKRLCIFHGIPSKTRQVFRPDKEKNMTEFIYRTYPADIYISGHMHVLRETVHKDALFLNSGSVGLPTFAAGFSYMLLDIENNVAVVQQRVLPFTLAEILQEAKKAPTEYYTSIWFDFFCHSLQSKQDEMMFFLQSAYAMEKADVAIGHNYPISSEVFAKTKELWYQTHYRYSAML